jgi:hypothetical protein
MAAMIEKVHGRGVRHLKAETRRQGKKYFMGAGLNAFVTAGTGQQEIQFLESVRRTNPVFCPRGGPFVGNPEDGLGRFLGTKSE